jgi:hypothetical protein
VEQVEQQWSKTEHTMEDDKMKTAALKRLGKLYRKPASLLQGGAEDEIPGIIVAPQGVEQASSELPLELKKWPPFPRYLVAEMERSGIKRPRAVAWMRQAWMNAGGAP